jgi:hypothetical protein
MSTERGGALKIIKVGDNRRVPPRSITKSQTGGAGQLYPRVNIGALPDDVLIEIFDLYVDENRDDLAMWGPRPGDAWHTLVHVCHRWRCVVFGSPRRLRLQLLCSNERSVGKMLDIWPALPIAIRSYGTKSQWRDTANVVAALEQRNRVCTIDIDSIPNLLFRKIVTTEVSFPALTDLRLSSHFGHIEPILPGSFLGASAPLLRSLWLEGFAGQAIGKLLLSTRDLVNLYLWSIPRSGFTSAEGIITSLSSLTRLESLSLGFRSQFEADQAIRCPPAHTRIVLPALSRLWIQGDCDYLEVIASHIDAPPLESATIVFYNREPFDTPLLRNFISPIETFKLAHRADLLLSDLEVKITLFRQKEGTDDFGALELRVRSNPWHWQLAAFVQVCTSAIPHLYTLELLRIRDYRQSSQNDMEYTQWRDLLLPFTSVKDLVLSEKSVPLVAPSLEYLAEEGVAEVFPELQSLCLEGPRPSGSLQEAIGRFVATRQLSGRSVVVHYLEESEGS